MFHNCLPPNQSFDGVPARPARQLQALVRRRWQEAALSAPAEVRPGQGQGAPAPVSASMSWTKTTPGIDAAGRLGH